MLSKEGKKARNIKLIIIFCKMPPLPLPPREALPLGSEAGIFLWIKGLEPLQ
jgi:hypothetical protein